MRQAEPVQETIRKLLKTPIGKLAADPSFGFEALEDDGSTKQGLSEQVLAAMARAALTGWIEGVVFNEITAHRDEAGQLMRIEVDYLDQIHDPAPRSVTVSYEDD